MDALKLMLDDFFDWFLDDYHGCIRLSMALSCVLSLYNILSLLYGVI